VSDSVDYDLIVIGAGSGGVSVGPHVLPARCASSGVESRYLVAPA